MQARVERSRVPGLRLKRLGIDTQQEFVIFMRRDCHVCRSEGFTSHARIEVSLGSKSVIATLGQVTSDLLGHGEASLSEAAWHAVGARDGDEIVVRHTPPLESLGQIRAKIYGRQLTEPGFRAIVEDVVAGRYSDIHLSAFVTACSGDHLDRGEMIALTRAMVDAGDRLTWHTAPIMDKHSVGGLPGNRTTPIIVAITTACGLTMPKTSSRAITSPAGTADTMETLAPVDLDLATIRRVVEREGGCIAWGGGVRLSPADDILIRVERALDLDSTGQLVASVLSKKAAAGSTHVVIDLPVGPTAKVRSRAEADRLIADLMAVSSALGMRLRVVETDGMQPVGRGIGPALEARDVLAVLKGAPGAPEALRARAIALAGAVLELGSAAPEGQGTAVAETALKDGRAWAKFQAICDAQGGMRIPPRAAHTHPIGADRDGTVEVIDNRVLARVAKLAGAPHAKAAGVELHTPLGSRVSKSQPLFTVHAESPGELAYALDYVNGRTDIVQLGVAR